MSTRKIKRGDVVTCAGRTWGVVRVSAKTGSLTLQPTGGGPFKFTDYIVVAPYDVKLYQP